MASRQEIVEEFNRTLQPNGQIDFDSVRRAKLSGLAAHTGRPLLIYAADFLNSQKAVACGGEVNLDFQDKTAFAECTRNLQGPTIDVLVHSPGGLAEAAESIVKILRHKFSDVRFIVPNIAKSAATMLVLSGDSLVMDELSELGPTDPQFSIPRSDGTRTYAPAQAIIDQFDEASTQLKADPGLLPAWIPILPSYGPSLYQECKNAIKLSEILVREWLANYMFGGSSRRRALRASRRVARYFANHNNFYTHMRRVDIDKAIELGLVVHDMRADPNLQTLVHDAYHALAITFEMTGPLRSWRTRLPLPGPREIATSVCCKPFPCSFR